MTRSMTRPERGWAFWVSTGLGSGLMRPGPGTWGTLASLPPGIGLLLLGGVPLLSAGFFILLPVSFLAIKDFLRKDPDHKKDPSEVVIDEILGMWVTLLAVPMSPFSVFAGFVLFRFFDILKPWPVCWFDRRWTGPAGIIADDLMAGLYAAFCLLVAYDAGLF